MDMKLGLTQAVIGECKRQGLLRNQAAYVLATAFWESGRTMEPVIEAYWLSENWRKTHLRYYPWYGRGLVQLTWEDNYKRAARETGIPMDKNPDLARDSGAAVKVLVLGMMEGWFTGKKLSDYITLQHSDFVNARRIINGTDKAAEIAHLAMEYDAALKAAGYGEGSSASAVVPPHVDPPLPDPSTAAPQVGEKPNVTVVEGTKPDETQVVIVKTPQNPPATHPLPSNAAGFTAFGAMLVALVGGALKYFGAI